MTYNYNLFEYEDNDIKLYESDINRLVKKLVDQLTLGYSRLTDLPSNEPNTIYKYFSWGSDSMKMMNKKFPELWNKLLIQEKTALPVRVSYIPDCETYGTIKILFDKKDYYNRLAEIEVNKILEDLND